MRPITKTLLFATLASLGCAPIRKPEQGSALRDEDGPAGALDAKLEAAWKRFDLAQAFAIDKVVVKKELISRAEWEAKLAAPAGAGLTEADGAALRQRHDALVAAAKAKAEQDSVLDLGKLRGSGDERAFCHAFPKGTLLHIHPWGTLDRATVREVLEKVDPLINFAALATSLNNPGGTGTLYPEEHAALQAVATRAGGPKKYNQLATDADRKVIEDLYFLPPGNHPFDRFTGTFTAISALTFGGSYDAEPLMLDRYFERLKKHNVRYTEISRFIIPKPQWIQSLDAWAAEVKQKHGIVVRYLSAYSRIKEPEFTRGKADQLLKLPSSKILTGINFLADETNFPALEAGQTLYLPVLAAYKAGKTTLGRTIHAGELGDARNVRDSIIMGADRVGHGVLFKDDPLTVELARQRRTLVEVNLNSNLRLKVLEDLSQHPFLRYIRLGIPVSFSTDDEGIFESTIDDECLLAIAHSDITYAELKRTSYDGVTGAFTDAATKAELKAALDQDFVAFEAAWNDKLRR